ncbi:hypothetical protein Tco_0936705 [Tanacetum coccineum]|uniref:Uncharacterized protein n=1 Tax=Tanacetum coccineum TaxID=301880 RepID=A0ABQ5DC64_9ASTR
MGKKIVVTEASVRRDHQLDDEEGTNCLPNATIFEELTRIGQGKDFSGRETPLFPTMVVQAQEEMGKVKKLEKKGGSRTHKLKRLYKVGRSARIVSSDEASLSDQEDASKQGRKFHDIDVDEDITLENVHDDDDIMFDMSDLAGEEVFFAEQGVSDNKKDYAAQVNTAAVSTASTILVSAATITEDEITLAQALAKLKSAKPIAAASIRTKAKGLVIHEEEQATTPIVSSQQQSQVKVQEKGKGILDGKPKRLKSKSFANIQELFDKAFKRVNTFVDFRTELVKGTEMEESSKKAEESNALDREDLETLWKLVKAKHGYTRPEEGYERVLWGDLKTMFEHHVEDVVWRNL